MIGDKYFRSVNRTGPIMKRAQIIHNPSAGDADHTREELLDTVTKAGYTAKYVSTEDGDNWKNFGPDDVDIVFLVGGDGTVRKLADVLLTHIPDRRIPVHLLPLGTANNIARTLQISKETAGRSLDVERKTRAFDCGRIVGLPHQQFFLESVGFGIFPELIFEMKKNRAKDISSNKLEKALKVLLQIVKDFEPRKATMEVDGIVIEGSFLLVELMNIPYLGPNIKLAPHADPGDGHFELVLVPGSRRAELEGYLDNMIKGTPENADLEKFTRTIRVRKVKMGWAGSRAHVDDRLIDGRSGKSFEVDLMPGALEFVYNI
jgi:diacylglycerol kinase family enzyme